ncbi:MAG TPA: 4Fe-4S dicluster domain-containing protein [Casimicrobiaceae bacterium]|nr:4Fe-4S dicluster domain-containing protein [Casimicrobiaceae bacterium]
MPIHEKSLIRPENLLTHEKLVVDGVDVSGHWSTFIAPRVVTDYNERLQEEIAALPGGEYVHRCWQCGSCTNACTVNAINPDFNPRFWIYLIRMGMESELLRDKDIIWQCVSCHKCTYACPRDVVPEGVMKATARWLELKGHTPKSKSAIFDEEFSDQVIATGKIEEGRIIRNFFARTGQPLRQDWLVEMAKRIARRLPVKLGLIMGFAALVRPRTRGWTKARAAIERHVAEQEAKQRAALGLTPAAGPSPPARTGARHS